MKDQNEILQTNVRACIGQLVIENLSLKAEIEALKALLAAKTTAPA